MKKIILMLTVGFTSAFSFVACDKDSATDLTASESLTVSERNTSVTNIAFADIKDQLTAKIEAGSFGMTMEILVGKQTLPSTGKRVPLPPPLEIVGDNGCTPTPPNPSPKDLEMIQQAQPKMSVTALRMLDKISLEISLLAPSSDVLKAMKTGITQELQLSKNVALTDRMAETLKVPQGSYLQAGTYPIKSAKDAPYGKMVVKVVSKK